MIEIIVIIVAIILFAVLLIRARETEEKAAEEKKEQPKKEKRTLWEKIWQRKRGKTSQKYEVPTSPILRKDFSPEAITRRELEEIRRGLYPDEGKRR